ncbi:unnamed protein product, partial [Ectocarpus fasciculatus]
MLVCPFVYYFFLWHWPYYWCKFSEALGIKPAYLMSYFAHGMKLLQFAVILGALNSGVYSALGTTGTYYGVRFGEQVPWVTAFPYNLGLPDPQYWGSILTLVGLINFFQLKKAPYYVVVNILSYVFMMVVESTE